MQRRRVILAFIYTFNTAGAYVVARSAADALFLARAGVEWLPAMFVVSAVLLGLTSTLFGRFSGSTSLRKSILLTLLLLALSTIGLCTALNRFGESFWLLAAIYLLVELRGCLNSIQYGILLNELFADSSKFHSVNGLLGAAATFAGIGFGVFVGFEAKAIGVTQLLYIVAGLELSAMIPIVLLRNMPHDGSDAIKPTVPSLAAEAETGSVIPVRSTSGLRWAVRSPHVRGIASLVALAVIVATLVEFQWKAAVAAQFDTREGLMAEFFGIFYAMIGLASGAVQLLFTGRLLRRFSAPVLLSVLPLMLFATTINVLTASAERVLLWPMAGVKGCDVLKRSLNYPVILSLYAPLRNGPRRHAITFVTGIVKPVAEALAALLVLGLASYSGPRSVSYAIVVLLILWLGIVRRHRNQ